MKLEEMEKRMKNRTFFEKHIKHVHHRIWGKIEDEIMRVKHAWQRVYRGYDDTAYWGLDEYLGDIALPVLKYYRENNCCGAPNWRTDDKRPFKEIEKEWEEKLDKIILSFELMKEDSMCNLCAEDFDKNQKKIKEGLKEFAEYYQSLWS